MVTVAIKLKDTCSLEEKQWKPRQHIKKQRHYFANKGPYIQSYVFFHSHVWMWDLDNKDSWALKNDFELWSWRRLESPLDCKENKPVNPKGNQPEYSLEGLLLKLKLQYFGHLMWRADSLEKDPDAGKDWEQEEKGMTVTEMIGWYHWFNGHEFEQALGDSERQGSWCAAVHGVTKSRTRRRDWTDAVFTIVFTWVGKLSFLSLQFYFWLYVVLT